jgi:hypothetical protein
VQFKEFVPARTLPENTRRLGFAQIEDPAPFYIFTMYKIQKPEARCPTEPYRPELHNGVGTRYR